jgi:archaellum component FlaC
MTETDVLSVIYKFATPILIGVVSYFLKGIGKTVRQIESDITRFRIEYEGHRVILQEHKERLEKIENKLDQNDRDLKVFYMEFAADLKKKQS